LDDQRVADLLNQALQTRPAKQTHWSVRMITERAIRRNSFTSVRELKPQIELSVQRYNADASPFQWVATADSILQKVEKIAKRISATGH